MTKIKLTCTLPDGTTATRTTARAYTHVACGRRSYEAALANAQRPSAVDRSNFKHYQEYVDGTSRFLIQPNYLNAEQHAAQSCKAIARARKAIGNCQTADEYVAAQTKLRIDDVELDRAAGVFDRWEVIGWSSRADLASKAAASANSHGSYAETRVVPVN